MHHTLFIYGLCPDQGTTLIALTALIRAPRLYIKRVDNNISLAMRVSYFCHKNYIFIFSISPKNPSPFPSMSAAGLLGPYLVFPWFVQLGNSGG